MNILKRSLLKRSLLNSSLLNSSLKEYIYGVGIGGITGGTCGFGLGIVYTYPNLRSEHKFQRKLALKKIESFTVLGTVFGSTIVGSVVNPVISGCVFLMGTLPIYLRAKFK